MLDARKLRMIELKIAHPTYSNPRLAKELDVSRQAIWEWMKDKEVQAELDRRLRDIQRSATYHLQSRTNDLMDDLIKLATNPKTEARVRSGALQYLLDRSMGKAAEQVSIDVNDGATDAADVLNGFKEFLTKNGYYKSDEKEDNTNE